jgi:hypothetical protein
LERSVILFLNESFHAPPPKNLELLLRDVHQKGFLDLELLYQLKQKEEVKRVEKEIADRIENPLEEGTPLFQRVFERCLSS